MKKYYYYMSETTGEIVPKLRDVVRVAMTDLFRYHILNIKWKYNKGGY